MQAQEHEQQPTKPPVNPKRKFWLKIAGGFFLLCGFIFLVYWLLVGRFYETTDDAYVAGNQVQVMPQITGHVTKILADETDLVKKGNPIIYLDKVDQEIALENAKASLALILRQTKQLYFAVLQQRANVSIQEAALERIQEDLQRRKILMAQRVISTEDFRHFQIDTNSATASLMLAKAQLASSTALVSNSNLYMHPQVQQAIVALRNAYLNLQRTTIYAPETGYVAKRPVQVGQEVTPNVVLMVIVPLDQVWVNANYKETQLRNIRLNQPVTLTADAYGRGVTYHGKVVGLSPGAGSVFDLLPPQNATGNWIKIVQRLPVRIGIDPKELEQYPLRLGLSVYTHINTHNLRGTSLSKKVSNKVIYETQNYSDQLEGANKLVEQILKSNVENISFSMLPQVPTVPTTPTATTSSPASRAAPVSKASPLNTPAVRIPPNISPMPQGQACSPSQDSN